MSPGQCDMRVTINVGSLLQVVNLRCGNTTCDHHDAASLCCLLKRVDIDKWGACGMKGYEKDRGAGKGVTETGKGG